MLGEMMLDTAVNIKQCGTKNADYFNVVEGADLVAGVFSMPIDQLRRGLIFSVSPVGQNANRLIDRKDWMQVASGIQQYYSSILELAQFTGDQQLMGVIIKKALSASTEAMRQFLETYDIRNIDRILVKELETMLSEETNVQGSQQLLGPGGNRGSASPNQAPGMEFLSQISDALNR
jgi:hypothetical protein